MRGVNRVTLLGACGKDPSIREIEGGVKVASFPLATNRQWKDANGEKHQAVDWHNIVMWRGIAESAQASELKKSDVIYIEGSIRSRKHTDKDGNEKHSVEIIVENFTIVMRYASHKDAIVIG